jgi:hypothetical protein
MRVAIGLKARTGRAVLVAVGGEGDALSLVERSQFITVPAGEWAPYHAAEGLDPAVARRQVERSIATSHRMAETAIGEAVRRLRRSGHELEACAVLVGTGMPAWTTEEILSVHVRMHQAEGELFRDVLLAGARASGLAVTELPDKTALDSAAHALRWTRARLDASIAVLGKSAGPPWGKDQKEAAAAALVAWHAAGPESQH